MTTIIYGLLDPTNHKISYIGQTNDLYGRWEDHLTDLSNHSKAQWIMRMRTSGLTPILVILEQVSEEEDPDAIERQWIMQGFLAGWPLTNVVYNGIYDEARTTASYQGRLAMITVRKLRTSTLDSSGVDTNIHGHILELHRQGYSRNAISKTLFGHKDGGTMRMIASVLNGSE